VSAPITEKEKIAFAESWIARKPSIKVIVPKGALAGLASSSSDTKKVSSPLRWVHCGIMEYYTIIVWKELLPTRGLMLMKWIWIVFYNAEMSYATGLKFIEWKIGGGFNHSDDHLDRIGITIWSNIQPWQSSLVVSKTINSIVFSATGAD